ncbi:MAG: FAD-dependent monooxygenase [Anaerolineaceae bacterium]|nr:FAD-dependent monooxygenase [Anaerolineaceae bacterium]
MSDDPVLIVGAGPTGMTAALDLAHYGIRSILFDEDQILSEGSRAIAFSSATLAVWEKLGAAQAMLAKGVAWSVRHTYFGEGEIYTQNFSQPAAGYLPRFFNLPQYYVERYLLDCIEESQLIDVRWNHKILGFEEQTGTVVLKVSTPLGEQEFKGSYVLACDGARSSMRKLLNLPFPGVTHNDHFLIADVRVDLQSPPEPRFYFNHPTNPGQTVLIHPQPDGIWRMDWQVGAEVDMQVERQPERIDRRIRALIGDLPYEIVWLTDYRFHQRLLQQFRHGQVFFLGDAAHLVAPFGARGLNSAVADVDNLVWKLALVINHNAPDSLLDTYQTERWPAQLHNQEVTNATMLFMSPPNKWRRSLRNLILWLSGFYPTARRWVNSGKMAEPFTYTESPLLTPDESPSKDWQGALPIGSQIPDMLCSCLTDSERTPIFLRSLIGSGFVVFYFAAQPAVGQPINPLSCPDLPGIPVRVYTIVTKSPEQPLQGTLLVDESSTLFKIFAAQPGTLYLIRPDGHISARRRNAQSSELAALLCKACGVR